MVQPFTLTYPCGCVVVPDGCGDGAFAARCGTARCWNPRIQKAADTAKRKLADLR